MKKINKILVANRGEIALRIMRTCKRLGIQTVAIYSDADATAPHVCYADESYHVGPPPSSESYLRTDKILKACQMLGVDAIHPGYGFLSENGVFARQVEEAGITFIGPSPEAIRIMGSKLEAKSAVSNYDIPLVPGTEDAVSDPEVARKIADEIGYPVLIKASAGGGGKGMRVVHHSKDIKNEMERAISEATSAFGDGAVFIEKFISSNKHIEFQILGDHHGNIVHVFDRECSIQRRHQKVIEEAPSLVLDDELRNKMGQAAVDVARSCNYYGAGTVEFIFDENKNFYFLEMNTRLQVEHPVSEEISGLDLVEEQIRIAEGHPLPFTQEDLQINGHSIEVRVYAEDPANDFLPDIGTLKKYAQPQGPGVRVDDGFTEGMEIPIFYDPMISKLIVHAENRDAAIDKMTGAILDYVVVGVETTLDFCSYVINHPVFRDGSFTTKFVEEHFDPATFNQGDDKEAMEVAAAIVSSVYANKEEKQKPRFSSSSWKLRNR